MLTFGDGVSDVDLTALLTSLRSHGRFGNMRVEYSRVTNFEELSANNKTP